MDDAQEKSQEFAEQERALREDIERSARELDKLEADRARVEDELRALTAESPRYEELIRVCASLEALEEAGAADLFWGDDLGSGVAEARIAEARSRAGKYQNEVSGLRAEHDRLAREVGKKNLVMEHLDFSLAVAIEEEEARRAEWLIERDDTEKGFARLMVMPWTRGSEEDERFQKAFAASALVAMLLGVAIPFIDLPIPERSQLIEIPERVARLVEMNRPKPEETVQPLVEEPEPEPEPDEPEPEPEELVAEEVVPELSDEPAPQVAEAPQEVNTREQVKSKGILAFRESFASRSQNRTRPRLGAQAQVSNAGAEAVGRPSRSMVATNAPGSSGGINLASISRDVGGGAGGGAIGGVEVTQVASSIGGNGTANRPFAGTPSAGRTDEEIQIVFDRYKAALYRLYNRELRKDPTLRGQIVLKLTIEPDGSVSFCELDSTDMDAPTLAQQIVTRVSGFDFGAKEDILAVTIVYPIDFLPAV